MEPPGRPDKSPSYPSFSSTGQMTLVDSSDDEPWLHLTMGPSKMALEEFRRIYREEAKQEAAGHAKASTGDNVDHYETVLSPIKRKVSGQMTLLDSSDDVPWLHLTLGPSEMALEEFRRIQHEEARKEDARHAKASIEMTLTGPKKFYCRYCAKSFDNAQVLGGHTGNCKKTASSGKKKLYCKCCAKDFTSSSALGGHMGRCKNLARPIDFSNPLVVQEEKQETDASTPYLGAAAVVTQEQNQNLALNLSSTCDNSASEDADSEDQPCGAGHSPEGTP